MLTRTPKWGIPLCYPFQIPRHSVIHNGFPGRKNHLTTSTIALVIQDVYQMEHSVLALNLQQNAKSYLVLIDDIICVCSVLSCTWNDCSTLFCVSSLIWCFTRILVCAETSERIDFISIDALRSVCTDHVSDVLPSSSIELGTLSTSSYACISHYSAICVYERRRSLFQA